MKKLSRPSEIRNDEEIVLSVRQWVNTFVMEMNLCPFAKYEMLNNRVRFATTRAITEEQLLMSLQDELELLNSDPSVETTLLIHPNVLQDFYDYNQFLSNADNLLLEMGLEGTIRSPVFIQTINLAVQIRTMQRIIQTAHPTPCCTLFGRRVLSKLLWNILMSIKFQYETWR